MNSQPIFPNEIFNLIDQIAYEDCQTDDYDSSLWSGLCLSRMALVCSRFAGECQKRLFFAIHVEYYGSAASRFATILAESPHLAKLVRWFSFRIYEQPDTTKDYESEEAALKQLTNVRSLSVTCALHSGWSSDSVHRRVLLHLFQLPTLVSLHLESIFDFSVSDLSRCASLRHLTLSCVGSIRGDWEVGLPLPANFEPIILDSLTMDCTADTYYLCAAMKTTLGRPVLDFSKLLQLSIMEYPSFETLEQVASTTTFHELVTVTTNFRQMPYLTPGWTISGLARLLEPSIGTLRNLNVVGYFDEFTNLPYPLADLITALEPLLGQNVLETLDIEYWICLVDHFPLDGWHHLASFLVPPESWPRLKRLSLKFKRGAYQEETDEWDSDSGQGPTDCKEITLQLRKQFAALLNSNRVQFELVCEV